MSDTVKWSEVRGNKFRTAPTGEMLSGTVVLSKQVPLINGSKYKAFAPTSAIEYNRDYVITWIVVCLLRNLGLRTKKELDKLMIEAWEAYKAEA